MAVSDHVKNGFAQPKSTASDDNAMFVQGSFVAETITFVAAAGGANVSEITISILDGHGDAVASPQPLLVWLSDAATGVGVTSTAASGTVTAKSASGADMGALTAKKVLVAQPLATGVFILEITDTAKTDFYVCAQNPVSGQVFVSDILVTADYG